MVGVLPDVHGSQLGHELLGLTSSPYIHVFVFLMFLDIITGYIKAFKLNKFDSKVGTMGFLRHIVVFLTIVFIGMYSRALGVRPFGIAWCLFFISTYAYSVLENWEVLGWGFPTWLKKYVNQMKKANDEQFAQMVGLSEEEIAAKEEKEKSDNDNS